MKSAQFKILEAQSPILDSSSDYISDEAITTNDMRMGAPVKREMVRVNAAFRRGPTQTLIATTLLGGCSKQHMRHIRVH